MQVINSPSVPTKFLDLKYVNIELGELPFGRSFDCSSLVYLFGAALSLGTFISHVSALLIILQIGVVGHGGTVN